MPRPLVLIFGESEYDCAALKVLVPALVDIDRLEVRSVRKPIVLQRNAAHAHRIKMSSLIAAAVASEEKVRPKVVAVAHRDCDALEPAHVASAEGLKADLVASGVSKPVAATPAWEMEAWWMLFPAAFASLRPGWAPLNIGNRSVGAIVNAKEFLIRALRPRGKSKCKDYAESDSPSIAAKIVEQNLLSSQAIGRSSSFRAFADELTKAFQAKS